MYVLMESTEVTGRPVGAEKLVFWRDGEGQVSCLRDKCPHRGVELSRGKVLNVHIQCPFHGLEYDTSGRAVLIPANGRTAAVPQAFKVHSYPTYADHDFIWAWRGENPPKDLSSPRFFGDIGEKLMQGDRPIIEYRRRREELVNARGMRRSMRT